MAQKPKKQSELMTQLRDNTKKEISPQDLRDAVVSASGPILIWSGKVQPMSYGNKSNESFKNVATTYMNPYYFNTGENKLHGDGSVWDLDGASVPGVKNGTYFGTSGGQGNFKAIIRVSDETVTSFEILDPGYGQVNGRSYKVYITGGNFKMKYNGALYNDTTTNSYFYFRGKGQDDKYHTWSNTIVSSSCIGPRKRISAHAHKFEDVSNVYGMYLEHDEKYGQMYVSVYKVVGA